MRLIATSHAPRACSDPPPNYKGDVAEWRAQEPINAHAHLLAMLVGSSESLPLVDGVLQIGTWQSLLLLELDGPRQRRVGVHIMGE
jgi:secondary thiamine-phosphate synthase enzyme